MKRLGRANERLGGNAAHIDARATDGSALEYGNRGAQLGSLESCGERSASGADDDQVEVPISARYGRDCPATRGFSIF